MRAFKVRLFEVSREGAGARAPVEVPGLAVDAEDIDGARAACVRKLTDVWKRDVRSVSCLLGDEAALTAVVYAEERSAP